MPEFCWAPSFFPVVPVLAFQKGGARPKDAGDAATQTLKTIYAARDALFVKRDYQFIIAYESSKYVQFDSDGDKSEKAEADLDLKGMFAEFPGISSVKTTINKVTVERNGLTADIKSVIKINVSDKFGTSHKLVVTFKKSDI